MSSPVPGRATEKRRGCFQEPRGVHASPQARPGLGQNTRCAETSPVPRRPSCRQALGWGWPGAAEEEARRLPCTNGLLVLLMRSSRWADRAGQHAFPCSDPPCRTHLARVERVQDLGAEGSVRQPQRSSLCYTEGTARLKSSIEFRRAIRARCRADHTQPGPGPHAEVRIAPSEGARRGNRCTQ